MPATAGAIASGHESVSAAAAELLESGANAFDAACAAAFAAAHAEPMFTSLGGGGFLLARRADGFERVYDFFADTPGRGLDAAALAPSFEPITVHFPASEQVFHVGAGSVAVPGTLAGLLHAHAALGRAELERVLEPARRLADEGVVLNDHQAYVIRLLEAILSSNDRIRALYLPEGRPPQTGERLRNEALAGFLERLPAAGAGALYAGEAARSVAREMADGGGLLGAEDLARYRVIEREPLVSEIAGRRVLTNPPPAFGGELLLRGLALHAELPSADWGSAREVVQRVAVMREVEAQRADPSPDHAAALRRIRRASGGTTHISVVDVEGNVASLSLSNGEGSGYVVPGTGIQLNNMLGEDDLHPGGFHASPPGERIASMMSPTIVLEPGAPPLALGRGGSKRRRWRSAAAAASASARRSPRYSPRCRATAAHSTRASRRRVCTGTARRSRPSPASPPKRSTHSPKAFR